MTCEIFIKKTFFIFDLSSAQNSRMIVTEIEHLMRILGSSMFGLLDADYSILNLLMRAPDGIEVFLTLIHHNQ